MPEGAISVARPSRWGNPFTVSEHGRSLAIALYRELVQGFWNPSFLDHLSEADYFRNSRAAAVWRKRIGGHPLEAARFELTGHDLGCWCPLVDEHGIKVPCHADVLLELLVPSKA